MRGRPRSLVRGVGINDVDGSPYTRDSDGKLIYICPFYSRWVCLLDRVYVYSKTAKGRAYKGCTVCEDWLKFSNFKDWMEEQDWVGKELDKDILGKGILYSPETCVFIHPLTNKFLIDKSQYLGEYLQGVYVPKKEDCYVGQFSDPFTNKRVTKRFEKELDAHVFYLKGKIGIGDKIAEMENNHEVKDYLHSFFRRRLASINKSQIKG